MSKYRSSARWRRPEKITGAIFLFILFIGLGLLAATVVPLIPVIIESAVWLTVSAVVFTTILYMLFDPKMRALVGYGFKSMIRWITGLFVEIDPIGVLKSYVDDLHDKLRHMKKQINQLRGQKHQLQEMIFKNKKQIQENLALAQEARKNNNEQMLILKSRKAGRLKNSNMRLDELLQKMNVLYGVLTRMYANSEILAEDIKDQVMIKEQERRAIHASTSAMRSARSVIQGDADKRAMFDQALEAIADDVGKKVGEMERFMEVSSNFMDSIDLQNGVFEEEGLEMLEKWQKESMANLLGMEASELVLQQAQADTATLDLNRPPAKQAEKSTPEGNQYDSFFE